MSRAKNKRKAKMARRRARVAEEARFWRNIGSHFVDHLFRRGEISQEDAHRGELLQL